LQHKDFQVLKARSHPSAFHHFPAQSHRRPKNGIEDELNCTDFYFISGNVDKALHFAKVFDALQKVNKGEHIVLNSFTRITVASSGSTICGKVNNRVNLNNSNYFPK
jgi:hypothetical protein